MSSRFTIRTLLLFAAFSAVTFGAWKWLRPQDPNQAVDRFLWNDRSNGIATQRWDFGWQYAGDIRGNGSCIVLHHYRPEHEVYGQHGGFEVVIQLPKDAAVGDQFALFPIPPDRKGEAQPHDRRYTLMLPGEFTVRTFGDHMGSLVAESEIRKSTVTLKTMSVDRVLIHVEVDVTIPEFYDINLDQDFTLKRNSKNDG
ncbi:hypothetical protein [Rubripirellula tenax]|uniref:hypothetical protein n=1 Tax=Rubripirellula tenax TaxID=2528015 RepID=UPI00164647CF|nr:hypothetical protein [Rubripirellula tenax]